MRKTFSGLLVASLFCGQALAAAGCLPIHEAPVTVSVSAKHGAIILHTNSQLVNGSSSGNGNGNGKPSTPSQPAETLKYVASGLAFSIVPIASCADGLQMELKFDNKTSQHLVGWGQETVVNGKAGSDHYIAVTARRL